MAAPLSRPSDLIFRAFHYFALIKCGKGDTQTEAEPMFLLFTALWKQVWKTVIPKKDLKERKKKPHTCLAVF